MSHNPPPKTIRLRPPPSGLYIVCGACVTAINAAIDRDLYATACISCGAELRVMDSGWERVRTEEGANAG